jgi:hypothetical protein
MTLRGFELETFDLQNSRASSVAHPAILQTCNCIAQNSANLEKYPRVLLPLR